MSANASHKALVAEAADEVMAYAARMAEGHRRKMHRMSGEQAFAYVEEIIGGAAEVVFGVWADHTNPRGYDSVIIKGSHIVAECAASLDENLISTSERAVRVDAIPCVCVEQALAAKDHFDRRH